VTAKTINRFLPLEIAPLTISGKIIEDPVMKGKDPEPNTR